MSAYKIQLLRNSSPNYTIAHTQGPLLYLFVVTKTNKPNESKHLLNCTSESKLSFENAFCNINKIIYNT